MSNASLPTNWVVIWGQWIIWRKNWVSTFEISSSTWDAYFRWNIYAESWTFTWTITSNAIITWWAFRTWSTNSRIELSSAFWVVSLDSNNYWRVQIPPWSDSIIFRDSSNATRATLKWLSWSRPIVWWIASYLFNESWWFFSQTDMLAFWNWIFWWTVMCWRFKLPVWSNLYE